MNEQNSMYFATGNGRVEIYDWVRLIATAFVVIGHSSYLYIQTTFGGVAYELPSKLNSAYNSPILSFCRKLSGWVYGFHMPLFFILSGAVLGLRFIPAFDHFVASKTKRLLIPYFIYGWLFMFPVKYLGNFYNKGTIFQAYRGFLSGMDSGHLWFLTALFWCMICFVIMQKILSKFTNSSYILLAIGGIIQLTYIYLPFDFLGLHTGLSYMFWFALGYVFEYERKAHGLWNIKKTIAAFIILTILELMARRYGILNTFFLILCGSFYTFLLSDICSRLFKSVTATRIWKIIIRNLFYVYLFHDPLEYIVLRIFMEKELLTTPLGCYTYTFCRTVLIFIITIILGEVVTALKGKMKIIFADSSKLIIERN